MITNQFKITLHNKYLIHNYAITLLPDTREGTTRLRDMIGRLDKELKLTFMNYLASGNNIFSPTFIEDEIEYHSNVGTTQYILKVKHVSSFSMDSIERCSMEKNPI